MIEKGKSKRIRRQLLTKQHTLTEALDLARAQEVADQQACKIERQRNEDVRKREEINKVSTRQPYNEGKVRKKCYNCGGIFPHEGGRMKCPAWGKKCLSCEKYNHFAKCCRSGNNKVREGKVKAVKADNDQSSSSSNDGESTYRMEVVGSIEKGKGRRPIRRIKIEDQEIKVLIDTGSTVNVMDECTYREKFAKTCKLRKSTSVIHSYHTSENPTPPLQIMGKIETVVESKERIITATFYVIKGDTKTEPLLSYGTAEKLRIVTIYGDEINTIQKQKSDSVQSDDLDKVKNKETTKNRIIQEHPEVFSGIGKMKGVLVDLHVDLEVEPVAQPHRRIPFSVRPQLEKELQKLEEQDIIEKVDKPTGWVSPTVVTPKKNNDIRLNVDMRVANNAIPRTHNIMPTVEDIITELNGATVFSHIDMKHGYHQLELNENSRNITTFSTHSGLYRYKRLNFGTKSAGEIFDSTIRKEITQDIPGCMNISDDILVHGKTQRDHDESLKRVIERAKEKGITFNSEKCEFNKKSCRYYGLIFSKFGVSPDPEKVKAIKAAKAPRNAKELNSFLCTVQYNSRFLDGYTASTDALRELVKASKFVWEKKHQEAFQRLKDGLSSDTVLAYFDPQAHHEVHVDGSPIGVSATLVQQRSKEEPCQVVQYASRALNSAEKKYSQIELEMLAVDFGCQKFHMYLYGNPFTVVSDHKPLEVIFNNPRHKTSLRLQRILVRMMDYDFKVKYQPGKDNISDYTSRHPVPSQRGNDKEDSHSDEVQQYVNFIIKNDIPSAITISEIVESTAKDNVLQKIIKCIKQGKLDQNDVDLKPYKEIFKELTNVEGMVMRGERIVIPRMLRDKTVEIAHEGHQGMVRTKQILRSHVWFPGIDAHVHKVIRKCIPCQAVTPEFHREPLQMTPIPSGPWKKVSIDFAGPFGSRMALVLWDQYSRMPIVEFVSTTSAECVVPKLEKIFTTYGVPEEIKSDNGPPFNGKRFADYAEEQGFKHRKVTPGWAEANGDIERFMRTVKKSAKIAKLEGRNVEQEVQTTVRSYKATPHPATGYSPNKLMFGRELKGKLPRKTEKENSKDIHKEVRKRDGAKKQQWKAYADKRRNVSNSRIEMGDQVLMKQKRQNMLTPYYDPRPFIVIGVKGSRITAARGSEVKSRNSSHFKRLETDEQDTIQISPEDNASAKTNEETEGIDQADQGLSGGTGAQLVQYDQFQEDQDNSPNHQESTFDNLSRRSNRNRIRTRDTLYKDFVCD